MRVLASVFCALLVSAHQAISGPIVELNGGSAEGVADGDVAVWRGIPFAEPPLGDMRWRPPQPAAAWNGTLDAREFRHNCMQQIGSGIQFPIETISEDCLYLNVYAPLVKPKEQKPVMLWIYGGGFQQGGGNETRLNGTWDVALTRGELLIVTFNYRLNVFGFAASDRLRNRDAERGTGNYGIQDQRMAMRWVSDNIAAFGGDPSRVFLVGQSAGANSVSNHLVREASWGLFSAAGLESGAFYKGVEETVQDKEPAFDDLLTEAGCSDVVCLLDVPAEKLLGFHTKWNPVIDGVDLVDAGPTLAEQGRLAPVPVLVGSVMEDIGYGSMNCNAAECAEDDFRKWGQDSGFNDTEVDRLVHAYSDEARRPGGNNSKWWWAFKHAGADYWGTCAARRLARWATEAGQDAYLYYWTYPPMSYNGRYPQLAHHACEQPFVFHVLAETPQESAGDHGAYHIQPEERQFSAAVVHYWTSFAATGTPDGDVAWPRYDAGAERALIVGDLDGSAGSMSFEVAESVRGARCDFWDDHFREEAGRSVEPPVGGSARVLV